MILAVDRKRMLVAARERDEIAEFEAHIATAETFATLFRDL